MEGILTGFFATDKISGGPNGVFYASTEVDGKQLGNQLYAIIIAVCWSVFATYIILITIDICIGVRVDEETERTGLDRGLHGESMQRMKTLTSFPIPNKEVEIIEHDKDKHANKLEEGKSNNEESQAVVALNQA